MFVQFVPVFDLIPVSINILDDHAPFRDPSQIISSPDFKGVTSPVCLYLPSKDAELLTNMVDPLDLGDKIEGSQLLCHNLPGGWIQFLVVGENANFLLCVGFLESYHCCMLIT